MSETRFSYTHIVRKDGAATGVGFQFGVAVAFRQHPVLQYKKSAALDRWLEISVRPVITTERTETLAKEVLLGIKTILLQSETKGMMVDSHSVANLIVRANAGFPLEQIEHAVHSCLEAHGFKMPTLGK